jgi:hypothetical protein
VFAFELSGKSLPAPEKYTQGLKPEMVASLTARLKSGPVTNLLRFP